MKVLVTGSNGQIACSLREAAVRYPKLDFAFVTRPLLDLAQPGSAAAFIASHRPHVVINAAAYTAVDEAEDESELAFRINSEGAGEVAYAAAKVDAQIVQLSTDYVFSGEKERPYRENDPTAPINVYGASKLSGEEQVRSANDRHLIIRTSWVVSPFGRNFIKTMINAARTREVLRVVDDQRGRPTSAQDLAAAIAALLDRSSCGDEIGVGETYHVANAGQASWFELACSVIDASMQMGASKARVEPITTAEWPTRARRPASSILDCSRFERDFGWKLQDWRSFIVPVVERVLSSSH